MNAHGTHSQTECDTGRQRVSADTIDACRRGDHTAFHELYAQCSQSVYGLMVRIVGRQNADDLTQQVFLQIFRSIAKFSGRSRIETWIHRVAVNEALQHMRRRPSRAIQTLSYEPAEPIDRHSGQSEQSEQRDLLDQALARIDPELRSLFLLREVEGFSYAELAEAVAIPDGTVGSRLNRARRELRQHLADLGWEG